MRLGTKAKHQIRAIWPEQASRIDALVNGTLDPTTFEDCHRWVSQCYNEPSEEEQIMCALNELIDGSGVEALGEVDMHDGPPFEYINMGDTYDTTLIHDTARGLLFVSTAGDVAERYNL